MRPIAVGKEVRRADGRTFRITFLSRSVFSAEPTDGKWSWWGGPTSNLLPSADTNEGNETDD